MGHGHVVAAPDDFKGTVSAIDAAASIGHACWELGLDCVEVPMSDGGDGLLDVLGGPNRTTTVTGPLGSPVAASWRLADGVAVIEMARASGLVAAGGAENNRPLDATTAGTGELIDRALDAGAKRIIVGLGGSATTDGGYGALRAIAGKARLRRVELLAACDVETTFVDAARVFAPQKGASDAEVDLLGRRLDRLAQLYEADYGIDVRSIAGAGAAGGLGGALAALGAQLVPGFELVADEQDLYDHLDGAAVVITGEGRLDGTSFDGKVVGGIAAIAADAEVDCVALVGTAAEGWREDLDPDQQAVADRVVVTSLADLVGPDRAHHEPKAAIEAAARLVLENHTSTS